MAAMLHDVGKVAISDTVLKKPSRFTPEEFEVMKQHTVLGARLFGDLLSEFDEAAAVVALNHHERWDGAGYPGHVDPRDGAPLPGHARADGSAAPKRAEEIPLFGRLVAVADVYDALCSRRCYKPAWDECEVVRTVRGEAGGQFDPELVEVFCATLEELHHISARYPDEE
jgi:HD-GYP domain-containing protein (c-di-GMP phosphodiesterase class II)